MKTDFTSNDDHNLASSNKPRIKSTSQANEDDDTFNDIARSMSPVTLSFENDIDRLTSELLVLGQYEKVVDLLIQETRFTDAILIANFFDKNLFAKTQQAYFRHNSKNKFSNVRNKERSFKKSFFKPFYFYETLMGGGIQILISQRI